MINYTNTYTHLEKQWSKMIKKIKENATKYIEHVVDRK